MLREYEQWELEQEFKSKLWLGEMLVIISELTEEIGLEPVSQWPVRNFLFFGSLLVNENASVLFDIEGQRIQVLMNGRTKKKDIDLAWKFTRDNDLQKYLDDFQRKTNKPVKDLEMMKRASQLRRIEKLTYAEISKIINEEFGTGYQWGNIQQIIRDYDDPRNFNLYKAPNIYPSENENSAIEEMTEIILDNYL